MESHLRVEIVPREAPAEVTSPRDGTCENTDPNDAHLTSEGAAYYAKQQWSARINGAEFPLAGYAVEYDPESGTPMLTLALSPDSMSIGATLAPTPPAPEAPKQVLSWGDGSIPDPREGIPGYQPEGLGEQVAGHAERVALRHILSPLTYLRRTGAGGGTAVVA
jgi:hypothetical protein